MEKFCKSLPKIELHAHLNGSLSTKTLLSLGCLDDNIKEYQKLTEILTKSSRTLEECFQLFRVAHKATNNAHAVYIATKSVIEDFCADGVIYLELRTTPREEATMTKEEYIQSVVTAVKDTQEELPIIVKLILCLDRKYDSDENEKLMDLIIQQYKNYSNIIVGVDLCGNPKLGYFPRQEFIKARKAGLNVTLHCGEIKGGSEEVDMLEYIPDRLGHGTFLDLLNTRIFNVVDQKKIPLEICLTSNVITGTVDHYDNHHIRTWMTKKLPFCLCTDDKGVFLSNLSNEYFLANKHYKLTAQELYEISAAAVDYIFAGPAVQNHLRNKFHEWKECNKARYF